jgi:hypothetical protein
MRTVLVILSILSVVLGFYIRAYTVGTTPKGTSGRNTKEQVAETLNTNGIYSMLRHPLYLGNYLIWAGIVIYTFSPVFFIIFSLAYWLYYERIMFAEERFLERKFGEEYTNWSQTVPAFLPAFSRYKKGKIPFRWKPVLRREYSGLLATLVGFAYVDLLRNIFHQEEFIWKNSLSALIAGLIVVLVLRTAKHSTKWLDD